MHDTSVPNLSVWSGPAAPLCCLANKSQARRCSESLQSALEANLNGPGSTIYQTVWKPHTTPLGRQIYRLRASGRRTSDSEPSLERSGWPTPQARDWKGPQGRAYKGEAIDMPAAASLSGWPTPMAGTPAQNGNNEAGNNDSSRKTVALSGWPTPTLGSPNSLRGHGQEPSIRKAGGHSVNLQDMVRLSGWTTPQAHDPSPRGSGQKLKHGTKHGCADLNADAALSGWPSPGASDGNGGKGPRTGVSMTGRMPDGSKVTMGLPATAKLALSGWPTPTSRDHKDGKECPNVPLNALLGRVAWLTANPQAARITADGTMLTGCSAGMESGGQLSPHMSRFLMGFPIEWCQAAMTAYAKKGK